MVKFGCVGGGERFVVVVSPWKIRLTQLCVELGVAKKNIQQKAILENLLNIDEHEIYINVQFKSFNF